MRHPQKRTAKIIGGSFLILFLVWQHIQATRLGYEVERSRREANIIKGRIASLRIELETSLSPAQLASVAGTKLGMFPAAPDCLRYVGVGQAAPVRLPRLFSRWLAKSWLSFLHA